MASFFIAIWSMTTDVNVNSRRLTAGIVATPVANLPPVSMTPAVTSFARLILNLVTTAVDLPPFK